jgi:LysM repeat protein
MKKLKVLIRIFTMIFTLYGLGNMVFGEKDQTENPQHFVEVRVHEGQTLWEIADNFITQTSYTKREFIYQISQKNNIINAMIYPGQTLKIPVNEKLIVAAKN